MIKNVRLLVITGMIGTQILFFGCNKDSDNEPGTYSLTVTDGTGSGSYASGTTVNIEANQPPDGEEFDQWAGDIDHLNDSQNPSATITMPSQDISVNAVFRPLEYENLVSVSIDYGTQFQTMDGFGFFGARDVWWGSSDPSHFYSDAWLEKVVGELGITIWRNELYPHNPPHTGNTPNQDANWDQQRPMVLALKEKADVYNVDLRIILTAWSPPGEFKWDSWGYTWPGDENAERGPGEDGDFWPERGQGLPDNNSGSLNPNKYADFAQWWIDAINMYKDAGLDVFAISPQNEPAFKQFFNSCFYTTHWYAEMINAVAPLIKAVHPNVLIFGSEHMLLNEGRDSDYPWFYHSRLKNDPTAMQYLDVLAVHGYQDGVNASSGSELAQYWSNHKREFTDPADKRAWMTETSGYVDDWEGSDGKPGALGLAIDILTGILFGDLSAWVYWQGSGLEGIDEFNLMSDLTVGKKFYASKNFYRFIRPGAIRVEASSPVEELAVAAFGHDTHDTQTIVLINTDSEDIPVSLEIAGADIPEELEMFVTSATRNCESSGSRPSDGVFLIPARSVVTLQAGGTVLDKEGQGD